MLDMNCTQYQGRPLRILQVHTLYPTYVPNYYALFPQVVRQSFASQVQKLYEHGLQDMYMVAPMLAKMGCETQLIYSNAHAAQHAWCVENGFPQEVFSAPGWEQKIVAAQIETFKPDVLFFSDNHHFDGHFLKGLSYTPKLIVAWRHAPMELSTYWHGYDIILSGSRRFTNLATHFGAKKALLYTFGLPVQEKVPYEHKKRELCFCGTYRSPFEPQSHSKRRKVLDRAARICAAENARCEFFLADVSNTLPEHVRKIARPPLYGKNMYHEMSYSSMGIDILGNATAKIQGHSILRLTAGDTVNMRLIEHVACNTLAFAESRGRLAQMFEPMKEVVTYDSHEDLEKKLQYFLRNREEAEVVADAGIARFKQDLNVTKTLKELLSIFQQGLRDKDFPEKAMPTTVIPPTAVLQKMVQLLGKFPAKASHAAQRDAWELEEQLFNIACALAVKGNYEQAFTLDTLIQKTPFIQNDLGFLV